MTRVPVPHPEQGFSLRGIAAAVFLPTLLFEVGVGAILPVIPLLGVDLGAGLATAGFLAALLGLGQIAGDLPAGALASRVGDRNAMLLAASVSVVTLSLCAVAWEPWVLAIGLLCQGAANSVFSLARQTYLTEVTPPMRRATVLSALGGTFRIGLFIGPFAGAGVIAWGGVRSAFWLAVGISVLTALVIWLVPDPVQAEVRRPGRRGERGPRPASMRQVFLDNRAVLGTLGVAVLGVGLVRGARQTVLPLWTEHLGLSPATTSVVFGVCSAIDMLLFYPAGRVMDRYGRLWIGVPSMVVMGVALGLLPLTASVAGVTVVAMLLGLGNGMGSGLLMTLGADAAPEGTRAQFLGIWRLIADSGSAGGPLVVAAGAAVGTLAGGVLAMAGIAFLAGGALWRWTPRSASRRIVVREGSAAPAPGDVAPRRDT